MKLTPKQNAVIWCLQNGWVIIASSESRKVVIANDEFEYRITSALFWKLSEEMDLITQTSTREGWDWVLTENGENIKTKPVTF